MKPIFKDILNSILGPLVVAIITFLIIIGIGYALLPNKIYDKIVDTCVFEAKKIDKTDAIKFDLNKSYALDTSNPDIWLVHLIASGQDNLTKETEKFRISCQVYRKDGNLQAELLNAHAK